MHLKMKKIKISHSKFEKYTSQVLEIYFEGIKRIIFNKVMYMRGFRERILYVLVKNF